MLLHRLTGLWHHQRTSWANAPVVAAPSRRAYCRSKKGHAEQDTQLLTCRSTVSSVQQVELQNAQPHHPSALETRTRAPDHEVAAHGVHQVLQRPIIHRPDTTGASTITPTHLAAVAGVLNMPIKQLQTLLHKFPQIMSRTPEQLAATLEAVQTELQLSQHELNLMVTHHADMVLSTPPAQLSARARALAAQLGVKPRDVLSVCGSIPSILKRQPNQLAKHLKAVAQVLGGVPMGAMLKLASAAPQLLTATPNCVRQRLAKLTCVLRKPPKLVVKMLQLQMDVLFMSPRVLKNKIAVLQCILNRPLRLVLPIVMACPQLMRTNLDAARAAYAALLPICGRNKDFTFGMVCHAPHLLLEHPQVLLGQARHVHLAARQAASWQAQLRKFSPAQVADCLGLTAPTYARLNYMLATAQVDVLSLHTILTVSRAAFLKQFPDSVPLMHVRRQEQELAPIPQWQPPPRSSAARLYEDGAWGHHAAHHGMAAAAGSGQRSRRRQAAHMAPGGMHHTNSSWHHAGAGYAHEEEQEEEEWLQRRQYPRHVYAQAEHDSVEEEEEEGGSVGRVWPHEQQHQGALSSMPDPHGMVNGWHDNGSLQGPAQQGSWHELEISHSNGYAQQDGFQRVPARDTSPSGEVRELHSPGRPALSSLLPPSYTPEQRQEQQQAGVGDHAQGWAGDAASTSQLDSPAASVSSRNGSSRNGRGRRQRSPGSGQSWSHVTGAGDGRWDNGLQFTAVQAQAGEAAGLAPDHQPQQPASQEPHALQHSDWPDHVQHQPLTLPVQHHAVGGHMVELTSHTRSLQALSHVTRQHVHAAAKHATPLPSSSKRAGAKQRSSQQYQQSAAGVDTQEDARDAARAFDRQQDESDGESDLEVMSLGSASHPSAGASAGQVAHRQGVLTHT